MIARTHEPRLWGLMAEFDNRHDLLDAANRAREAGYTRMDAYSPFPIHGLSEALGQPQTKLPALVLAGGVLGALGGFGLCYYMSAIAYPLNIGGRPLNSWPSFIPITFEVTVLVAALTAVIGMIALNGLPRPYHPVFNASRFAHASRNRFFLAIEAHDPKFALDDTRAFLEGTHTTGVVEVED